MELNEIFWRTVRAVAYDLHQLMHKFKSLTPLQRYAWCIAGIVLQLLKPSVNSRLASSLIRKKWNRLLERLIMVLTKEGDK